MISHEIYGCVLCAHTEKLPRADGLKAAQQMYCGLCTQSKKYALLALLIEYS